MSLPLFRWVVAAPLPLTQLLAEHGLTSALADGRVFVDGVRAAPGLTELHVGAVVEVFAPRPRADIRILDDRDDVFAVHKPAALPTEPDHGGADCVLGQLGKLLRVEPAGLFAVSRLDVGVSGVLLVTLGARSRERLLAERSAGRLRRRYVALAAGVPEPGEGDWREALGGKGPGKRAVDGRDPQNAHTHYRVVATAPPLSPAGFATALLALSPVTGRTHQLRVHAAAHQVPLLGDRKYGGPPRMTAADGSVRAFSQILLHSAWVEWGAAGQETRITSEPAEPLIEAWLALGGDLGALQRSLD
jgi:23S rRNA-/tRNA-specific pseudouridylate synthase